MQSRSGCFRKPARTKDLRGRTKRRTLRLAVDRSYDVFCTVDPKTKVKVARQEIDHGAVMVLHLTLTIVYRLK